MIRFLILSAMLSQTYNGTFSATGAQVIVFTNDGPKVLAHIGPRGPRLDAGMSDAGSI